MVVKCNIKKEGIKRSRDSSFLSFVTRQREDTERVLNGGTLQPWSGTAACGKLDSPLIPEKEEVPNRDRDSLEQDQPAHETPLSLMVACREGCERMNAATISLASSRLMFLSI
jgi:hypothetical protein